MNPSQNTSYTKSSSSGSYIRNPSNEKTTFLPRGLSTDPAQSSSTGARTGKQVSCGSSSTIPATMSSSISMSGSYDTNARKDRNVNNVSSMTSHGSGEKSKSGTYTSTFTAKSYAETLGDIGTVKPVPIQSSNRPGSSRYNPTVVPQVSPFAPGAMAISAGVGGIGSSRPSGYSSAGQSNGYIGATSGWKPGSALYSGAIAADADSSHSHSSYHHASVAPSTHGGQPNPFSAGTATLAMHPQYHHPPPLRSSLKKIWCKLREEEREQIGQFEAWAEIQGMCRNCFSPGTSPTQAPRRHHKGEKWSEKHGSWLRENKQSRREYSNEQLGSSSSSYSVSGYSDDSQWSEGTRKQKRIERQLRRERKKARRREQLANKSQSRGIIAGTVFAVRNALGVMSNTSKKDPSLFYDPGYDDKGRTNPRYYSGTQNRSPGTRHTRHPPPKSSMFRFASYWSGVKKNETTHSAVGSYSSKNSSKSSVLDQSTSSSYDPNLIYGSSFSSRESPDANGKRGYKEQSKRTFNIFSRTSKPAIDDSELSFSDGLGYGEFYGSSLKNKNSDSFSIRSNTSFTGSIASSVRSATRSISSAFYGMRKKRSNQLSSERRHSSDNYVQKRDREEDHSTGRSRSFGVDRRYSTGGGSSTRHGASKNSNGHALHSYFTASHKASGGSISSGGGGSGWFGGGAGGSGGSLSRGSSSPVSWLGGGAEGHFRTSRKKPKPGFFFSQSHSQINPHQHSRTSSSASFSSSNSAESHVSHRRSYSPTRQKKVTAGGSVFDGLFGRKSLKRSDKRKGKEKEVHANDHKKNYPTRDRNFNGETRKASGAGVGFFQNLKRHNSDRHEMSTPIPVPIQQSSERNSKSSHWKNINTTRIASALTGGRNNANINTNHHSTSYSSSPSSSSSSSGPSFQYRRRRHRRSVSSVAGSDAKIGESKSSTKLVVSPSTIFSAEHLQVSEKQKEKRKKQQQKDIMDTALRDRERANSMQQWDEDHERWRLGEEASARAHDREQVTRVHGVISERQEELLRHGGFKVPTAAVVRHSKRNEALEFGRDILPAGKAEYTQAEVTNAREKDLEKWSKEHEQRRVVGQTQGRFVSMPETAQTDAVIRSRAMELKGWKSERNGSLKQEQAPVMYIQEAQQTEEVATQSLGPSAVRQGELPERRRPQWQDPAHIQGAQLTESTMVRESEKQSWKTSSQRGSLQNEQDVSQLGAHIENGWVSKEKEVAHLTGSGKAEERNINREQQGLQQEEEREGHVASTQKYVNVQTKAPDIRLVQMHDQQEAGPHMSEPEGRKHMTRGAQAQESVQISNEKPRVDVEQLTQAQQELEIQKQCVMQQKQERIGERIIITAARDCADSQQRTEEIRNDQERIRPAEVMQVSRQQHEIRENEQLAQLQAREKEKEESINESERQRARIALQKQKEEIEKLIEAERATQRIAYRNSPEYREKDRLRRRERSKEREAERSKARKAEIEYVRKKLNLDANIPVDKSVTWSREEQEEVDPFGTWENWRGSVPELIETPPTPSCGAPRPAPRVHVEKRDCFSSAGGLQQLALQQSEQNKEETGKVEIQDVKIDSVPSAGGSVSDISDVTPEIVEAKLDFDDLGTIRSYPAPEVLITPVIDQSEFQILYSPQIPCDFNMAEIRQPEQADAIMNIDAPQVDTSPNVPIQNTVEQQEFGFSAKPIERTLVTQPVAEAFSTNYPEASTILDLGNTRASGIEKGSNQSDYTGEIDQQALEKYETQAANQVAEKSEIAQETLTLIQEQAASEEKSDRPQDNFFHSATNEAIPSLGLPENPEVLHVETSNQEHIKVWEEIKQCDTKMEDMKLVQQAEYRTQEEYQNQQGSEKQEKSSIWHTSRNRSETEPSTREKHEQQWSMPINKGVSIHDSTLHENFSFDAAGSSHTSGNSQIQTMPEGAIQTSEEAASNTGLTYDQVTSGPSPLPDFGCEPTLSSSEKQEKSTIWYTFSNHSEAKPGARKKQEQQWSMSVNEDVSIHDPTLRENVSFNAAESSYISGNPQIQTMPEGAIQISEEAASNMVLNNDQVAFGPFLPPNFGCEPALSSIRPAQSHRHTESNTSVSEIDRIVSGSGFGGDGVSPLAPIVDEFASSKPPCEPSVFDDVDDSLSSPPLRYHPTFGNAVNENDPSRLEKDIAMRALVATTAQDAGFSDDIVQQVLNSSPEKLDSGIKIKSGSNRSAFIDNLDKFNTESAARNRPRVHLEELEADDEVSGVGLLNEVYRNRHEEYLASQLEVDNKMAHVPTLSASSGPATFEWDAAAIPLPFSEPCSGASEVAHRKKGRTASTIPVQSSSPGSELSEIARRESPGSVYEDSHSTIASQLDTQRFEPIVGDSFLAFSGPESSITYSDATYTASAFSRFTEDAPSTAPTSVYVEGVTISESEASTPKRQSWAAGPEIDEDGQTTTAGDESDREELRREARRERRKKERRDLSDDATDIPPVQGHQERLKSDKSANQEEAETQSLTPHPASVTAPQKDEKTSSVWGRLFGRYSSKSSAARAVLDTEDNTGHRRAHSDFGLLEKPIKRASSDLSLRQEKDLSVQNTSQKTHSPLKDWQEVAYETIKQENKEREEKRERRQKRTHSFSAETSTTTPVDGTPAIGTPDCDRSTVTPLPAELNERIANLKSESEEEEFSGCLRGGDREFDGASIIDLLEAKERRKKREKEKGRRIARFGEESDSAQFQREQGTQRSFADKKFGFSYSSGQTTRTVELGSNFDGIQGRTDSGDYTMEKQVEDTEIEKLMSKTQEGKVKHSDAVHSPFIAVPGGGQQGLENRSNDGSDVATASGELVGGEGIVSFVNSADILCSHLPTNEQSSFYFPVVSTEIPLQSSPTGFPSLSPSEFCLPESNPNSPYQLPYVSADLPLLPCSTPDSPTLLPSDVPLPLSASNSPTLFLDTSHDVPQLPPSPVGHFPLWQHRSFSMGLPLPLPNASRDLEYSHPRSMLSPEDVVLPVSNPLSPYIHPVLPWYLPPLPESPLGSPILQPCSSSIAPPSLLPQVLGDLGYHDPLSILRPKDVVLPVSNPTSPYIHPVLPWYLPPLPKSPVGSPTILPYEIELPSSTSDSPLSVAEITSDLSLSPHSHTLTPETVDLPESNPDSPYILPSVSSDIPSLPPSPVDSQSFADRETQSQPESPFISAVVPSSLLPLPTSSMVLSTLLPQDMSLPSSREDSPYIFPVLSSGLSQLLQSDADSPTVLSGDFLLPLSGEGSPYVFPEPTSDLPPLPASRLSSPTLFERDIALPASSHNSPYTWPSVRDDLPQLPNSPGDSPVFQTSFADVPLPLSALGSPYSFPELSTELPPLPLSPWYSPTTHSRPQDTALPPSDPSSPYLLPDVENDLPQLPPSSCSSPVLVAAEVSLPNSLPGSPYDVHGVSTCLPMLPRSPWNSPTLGPRPYDVALPDSWPNSPYNFQLSPVDLPRLPDSPWDSPTDGVRPQEVFLHESCQGSPYSWSMLPEINLPSSRADSPYGLPPVPMDLPALPKSPWHSPTTLSGLTSVASQASSSYMSPDVPLDLPSSPDRPLSLLMPRPRPQETHLPKSSPGSPYSVCIEVDLPQLPCSPWDSPTFGPRPQDAALPGSNPGSPYQLTSTEPLPRLPFSPWDSPTIRPKPFEVILPVSRPQSPYNYPQVPTVLPLLPSSPWNSPTLGPCPQEISIPLSRPGSPYEYPEIPTPHLLPDSPWDSPTIVPGPHEVQLPRSSCQSPYQLPEVPGDLPLLPNSPWYSPTLGPRPYDISLPASLPDSPIMPPDIPAGLGQLPLSPWDSPTFGPCPQGTLLPLSRPQSPYEIPDAITEIMLPCSSWNSPTLGPRPTDLQLPISRPESPYSVPENVYQLPQLPESSWNSPTLLPRPQDTPLPESEQGSPYYLLEITTHGLPLPPSPWYSPTIGPGPQDVELPTSCLTSPYFPPDIPQGLPQLPFSPWNSPTLLPRPQEKQLPTSTPGSPYTFDDILPVELCIQLPPSLLNSPTQLPLQSDLELLSNLSSSHYDHSDMPYGAVREVQPCLNSSLPDSIPGSPYQFEDILPAEVIKSLPVSPLSSPTLPRPQDKALPASEPGSPYQLTDLQANESNKQLPQSPWCSPTLLPKPQEKELPLSIPDSPYQFADILPAISLKQLPSSPWDSPTLLPHPQNEPLPISLPGSPYSLSESRVQNPPELPMSPWDSPTLFPIPQEKELPASLPDSPYSLSGVRDLPELPISPWNSPIVSPSPLEKILPDSTPNSPYVLAETSENLSFLPVSPLDSPTLLPKFQDFELQPNIDVVQSQIPLTSSKIPLPETQPIHTDASSAKIAPVFEVSHENRATDNEPMEIANFVSEILTDDSQLSDQQAQKLSKSQRKLRRARRERLLAEKSVTALVSELNPSSVNPVLEMGQDTPFRDETTVSIAADPQVEAILSVAAQSLPSISEEQMETLALQDSSMDTGEAIAVDSQKHHGKVVLDPDFDNDELVFVPPKRLIDQRAVGGKGKDEDVGKEELDAASDFTVPNAIGSFIDTAVVQRQLNPQQQENVDKERTDALEELPTNKAEPEARPLKPSFWDTVWKSARKPSTEGKHAPVMEKVTTGEVSLFSIPFVQRNNTGAPSGPFDRLTRGLIFTGEASQQSASSALLDFQDEDESKNITLSTNLREPPSSVYTPLEVVSSGSENKKAKVGIKIVRDKRDDFESEIQPKDHVQITKVAQNVINDPSISSLSSIQHSDYLPPVQTVITGDGISTREPKRSVLERESESFTETSGLNDANMTLSPAEELRKPISATFSKDTEHITGVPLSTGFEVQDLLDVSRKDRSAIARSEEALSVSKNCLYTQPSPKEINTEPAEEFQKNSTVREKTQKSDFIPTTDTSTFEPDILNTLAVERAEVPETLVSKDPVVNNILTSHPSNTRPEATISRVLPGEKLPVGEVAPAYFNSTFPANKKLSKESSSLPQGPASQSPPSPLPFTSSPSQNLHTSKAHLLSPSLPQSSSLGSKPTLESFRRSSSELEYFTQKQTVESPAAPPSSDKEEKTTLAEAGALQLSYSDHSDPLKEFEQHPPSISEVQETSDGSYISTSAEEADLLVSVEANPGYQVSIQKVPREERANKDVIKISVHRPLHTQSSSGSLGSSTSQNSDSTDLGPEKEENTRSKTIYQSIFGGPLREDPSATDPFTSNPADQDSSREFKLFRRRSGSVSSERPASPDKEDPQRSTSNYRVSLPTISEQRTEDRISAPQLKRTTSLIPIQTPFEQPKPRSFSLYESPSNRPLESQKQSKVVASVPGSTTARRVNRLITQEDLINRLVSDVPRRAKSALAQYRPDLSSDEIRMQVLKRGQRAGTMPPSLRRVGSQLDSPRASGEHVIFGESNELKRKSPDNGVYEYVAVGECAPEPLSPTRPPSIRRTQSLKIVDLEQKLESLGNENTTLTQEKANLEKSLNHSRLAHQKSSAALNEKIEDATRVLREKQSQIEVLNKKIEWYQEEVIRLNNTNDSLSQTNASLHGYKQNYASLTERYEHKQEKLIKISQEHSQLQSRFEEMEINIENRIKSEIKDKDVELEMLRVELVKAREEVKNLQRRIAGRQSNRYLDLKGPTHFVESCRILFNDVQRWCDDFSRMSAGRKCVHVHRVTDDAVKEKFENVMLDDRGVRSMLKDEARRPQVFTAILMRLIWEMVFTRYLFGLEVEDRQNLLALECTLAEVGAPTAVHQWRATTLTLLSQRQTFRTRLTNEIESTVQEIMRHMDFLLRPPEHLARTAVSSLKRIISSAVTLALEMRTQRAEYVMLRAPRPEYDDNGEVCNTVFFDSSRMTSYPPDPRVTDVELEMVNATVKMVLFPLVIRRGNEYGEEYENEHIVSRMQVLVIRSQLRSESRSTTRSSVSTVWESTIGGMDRKSAVGRLTPITDHSPRTTPEKARGTLSPTLLPMIPEQTIRLVDVEEADKGYESPTPAELNRKFLRE